MFLVDARLDGGELVERSVVEIAPPQERLERVEEALPRLKVARDGPRLNEGETVPRQRAKEVEVARGLHLHSKVGDARLGPEPPVRAPHEVWAVARLENGVHALEYAVDFIGLPAVLGDGQCLGVVEGDEIDIRREIEITPAELAEAENEETRERLLVQLIPSHPQGTVECGFGERRLPRCELAELRALESGKRPRQEEALLERDQVFVGRSFSD